MKNRTAHTLTTVLLLVLAATRLQAQQPEKFAHTAAQIRYTFGHYHFRPLPVDDAFSERVFTLFKKQTDAYHIYLLQTQWDSLETYKHTLDNELNGENGGSFLARFGSMYQARWKKIDALVNVMYAKPLNYTVDEIYTLENENTVPFATEKEWEAHWRRKLKFSVLSRMAEQLGDKAPGTIPDPALEAGARKFMQKVYAKRVGKVLDPPQGYTQMLFERFFNCVALAYDPHSLFMPTQRKEEFDRELNAVKTSFGVEVDENDDGEFYVAAVIPGSAAWFSGEIKTDDILVRRIKKDKQEQEFIDLTADEVDEIFHSGKEETLTLVVKAGSDAERTVTLKKELIKEEEGLVKSWILKGEKNIGYISLPGFYFNWFAQNPSGCANDVAKEIIKMRGEKIEGLILDVRDNGGGAFHEAVEMAGIFIQEGPLLYTLEQGDKPKATKDPNRGTVYDGPMILMVNGQSASASEVLADILQDYNRAIIVGSPSFGKATMQITLPLDSMSLKALEVTGDAAYRNKENVDYANVTNGKLYRITGKNHQAYGVTPDIAIPEVWSMAYPREADYPYMLEADTIKGSPYFKPLEKPPVAELRQKSTARTATEALFVNYTQMAPEVKKMADREGQSFPLQWAKFVAAYRNTDEWWNRVDSLSLLENNTVFEVRGNSFNELQNIGNAYEAEYQNDMKAAIAADPQLMEAYRIMLDYILLITK